MKYDSEVSSGAPPYHYPAKWIPYPVQAIILSAICWIVIIAGIRAIT